MRLSRLRLDVANRIVRGALGDPQRMHQLVMVAFPDVAGPARSRLGVLHRVEVDDCGRCTLLVQSNEPPDWERLPDAVFDGSRDPSIEVRDLGPDLSALRGGEVLMFRLQANVTRRIDTKTRKDGVRRHGKRVPLRDHAARINWLRRKASVAGFEIVAGWSGEPDLRVVEHAPIQAQRGDGDQRRTITIEGVTFEGLLRVTDLAPFRAAVVAGIGPARAYGFGMLSFRSLR